MWTQENRARYDRSKLRYPSDLTDEEWTIIAPLIPPAKRGGNKRTIDGRAVVNGAMYILSTGCQWAALPKDLPPLGSAQSRSPRGPCCRHLLRQDPEEASSGTRHHPTHRVTISPNLLRHGTRWNQPVRPRRKIDGL